MLAAEDVVARRVAPAVHVEPNEIGQQNHRGDPQGRLRTRRHNRLGSVVSVQSRVDDLAPEIRIALDLARGFEPATRHVGEDEMLAWVFDRGGPLNTLKGILPANVFHEIFPHSNIRRGDTGAGSNGRLYNQCKCN